MLVELSVIYASTMPQDSILQPAARLDALPACSFGEPTERGRDELRVIGLKQIPPAYHLPNGNWRTVSGVQH